MHLHDFEIVFIPVSTVPRRAIDTEQRLLTRGDFVPEGILGNV